MKYRGTWSSPYKIVMNGGEPHDGVVVIARGQFDRPHELAETLRDVGMLPKGGRIKSIEHGCLGVITVECSMKAQFHPVLRLEPIA